MVIWLLPTCWSPYALMSSTSTNLCSEARCRASLKRQAAFLSITNLSHSGLRWQQHVNNLLVMAEADATPPLWNSCWTTSLWKSLKLSPTASKEGTLYWKHLPKTVQTKGIFWEIQGRKKATSEEWDAFEGRVATETPSPSEKEARLSPQCRFAIKKGAVTVMQWKELIFFFFIFRLLSLGGVDGCFGQKSLKGGFVTQDD